MANRDKVWKELNFRNKNKISLVISQTGKVQQKNQQYVHSAGGF